MCDAVAQDTANRDVNECSNINSVVGQTKFMTFVIICIILEHTIMIVNGMLPAYNYQYIVYLHLYLLLCQFQLFFTAHTHDTKPTSVVSFLITSSNT
jgi:hypothetical protein